MPVHYFDGGEIINGSHHWCFTALINNYFPLSFSYHYYTLRHSIAVVYVVLECVNCSLTGVEVLQLCMRIDPKCAALIEVGTYVSIRRKHSAVKPAITESGRAPRRDFDTYTVQDTDQIKM